MDARDYNLSPLAADAFQRILSSEGWALTEADIYVNKVGDVLLWMDEDTMVHITTDGRVFTAFGER
ncbi:hypothetical protein UB45_07705 [Terrabacter sp. 28]|nr:hypothetical protein UB45_07705 [Terrabacter sp. 28]